MKVLGTWFYLTEGIQGQNTGYDCSVSMIKEEFEIEELFCNVEQSGQL